MHPLEVLFFVAISGSILAAIVRKLSVIYSAWKDSQEIPIMPEGKYSDLATALLLSDKSMDEIKSEYGISREEVLKWVWRPNK